ncbi:hypothetical protein JTE90_020220 [Oedothorax gibbosus]|uniref:Uncharacterized protein n=1 Tax=Oedothorax gibbosus TaxID=931172 RepID=A0AAV6V1E9_9ARAC|nr:hypothetical protein JTE90_020220 [Oedothorax gibbosus]
MYQFRSIITKVNNNISSRPYHPPKSSYTNDTPSIPKGDDGISPASPGTRGVIQFGRRGIIQGVKHPQNGRR